MLLSGSGRVRRGVWKTAPGKPGEGPGLVEAGQEPVHDGMTAASAPTGFIGFVGKMLLPTLCLSPHVTGDGRSGRHRLVDFSQSLLDTHGEAGAGPGGHSEGKNRQ